MTETTRLYLKDWRVYRAAVVGGVVLLALPYVLALGAFLTWDARGVSEPTTVLEAALLGHSLVIVTAAVFGGAAFAAERGDRSAEFLAMLPVPRRTVVRAKLVAASTFLLAVVAVNAFVIIISAGILRVQAGHSRLFDQEFSILANTVSVVVMAYGVAWLMSSLLASPAMSATFSLALTTVTLVLTIDLARSDVDAYNLLSATSFLEGSGELAAAVVGPLTVQGLARLVMLACGALAWLAGTAVFLRRVSP